jgi:hypothetical protein
MFTFNSLKLVFSLFLAVSISSSSLAQPSPEQSVKNQTVPEQPTNNQITSNKKQINQLRVNTVVIEASNNKPFKIENVSEDKSWIVNIIFLFIGALFSYLANLFLAGEQRKKDKYRQSLVNTFEMMKEWDSESMRKARNIVFVENILDEYKKERSKENICNFSNLPPEKSVLPIMLAEFFDRLNFLKENEMVDEKAVKDYFSKDYSYWESKYFSLQRDRHKDKPMYRYAFENKYDWLFEISEPNNRRSP